MRNIIVTAAAGTALGFFAFAGTVPKDKSQPKEATSSAKTRATSSKSSASKTAASKKNAANPKQNASRYRRSVQQQPTSERYREIQRALSEKGYFGGPTDGNWGPESVEALKRFQRDQNLVDDGKIGSLSLIALGLGPKHEEARVSAPPTVP